MHVSVAPGRELEPISDRVVLVAGGGPTGLMLAGELALAGVDVAIIENGGPARA